jgi:hypothetical protein
MTTWGIEELEKRGGADIDITSGLSYSIQGPFHTTACLKNSNLDHDLELGNDDSKNPGNGFRFVYILKQAT